MYAAGIVTWFTTRQSFEIGGPTQTKVKELESFDGKALVANEDLIR